MNTRTLGCKYYFYFFDMETKPQGIVYYGGFSKKLNCQYVQNSVIQIRVKKKMIFQKCE